MPNFRASHTSRPWIHFCVEHAGWWMRLFDAACVAFSGYLATAGKWGWGNLPHPDYFQDLAAETLVVVLIFDYFGMYKSWRGRPLGEELGSLLPPAALSALGVALMGVLGHQYSHHSPAWMVFWWAAGVGLMISYRIVLRDVVGRLRKGGHNPQQVLLVVGNAAGAQIEQAIKQAGEAGLQVVGWVDDRDDAVHQPALQAPCVCNLAGLTDWIAGQPVRHVWLVYSFKQEERIHAAMHALRHSTCHIALAPNLAGFRLLNHAAGEVAGIPILHLSYGPMTTKMVLIKTVNDWLIAFIGVTLISPLLLYLAIRVKLSSPGPILFVQKRHGWDGRIINVYKFRTMRVHQEEQGKVTQATKGDSRITPFGAWLRRTSLDELPQLFNVLQGRMSLAGPRPHAVAHNEQYKDVVDDYMKRHHVKPGITGWAQVHGFRGETDTLEKMWKRVEYDLWYIENWSLGLDWKIYGLTLRRGATQDTAY